MIDQFSIEETNKNREQVILISLSNPLTKAKEMCSYLARLLNCLPDQKKKITKWSAGIVYDIK